MDQGRQERLESDNNLNEFSKKDGISSYTKEKVEAAKSYIERKYAKLKQEEQEKKENWDSLQKKMDDMNISEEERAKIKYEILHKEAEFLRMKRKKQSVKNFTPLSIIGRGAFGEVRLCRWNETNELVAVKKMKKSEMIYKNQVTHIRAERDVLVSADIPWIVDLKCSFQDEKHLYLVMEYLPGGDLMTLLMKKDILSEDEAKFYIAEAILAVDAVHKLNYIHRDLKPDNILIDSSGHIKLSDFGLCKHIGIRPKHLETHKNLDLDKPGGLQLDWGRKQAYKRNRQLAYSTVGTPDYIAPEVFGQNGYTETVDWWSLGVILFEMLVGYPPFYSEDPSSTCQKILNWRKTLVIPQEANLSPAGVDIIRKLIADPNERLGINGVEEIKFHPFFFGIDWKKIRDKKSSYIPELRNDIDTQHFDKFDEEEPWFDEEAHLNSKNKKKRKDVDFIGYTYDRNMENQRSSLVRALIDLETSKNSNQRSTPNKDPNSVKPQMTMSEQMVKSASLANLNERDSFTTSNFDTHERGFNAQQDNSAQLYSSMKFNEGAFSQKAAGPLGYLEGGSGQIKGVNSNFNNIPGNHAQGTNYKYFPINPQQIAMGGREIVNNPNKIFSPFTPQKQGLHQQPPSLPYNPQQSPYSQQQQQQFPYSQQQLYSSQQYSQPLGFAANEPVRNSKNFSPGIVNSPVGLSSITSETKYYQSSGMSKKNEMTPPTEQAGKNSQLKSNNVGLNQKYMPTGDKFPVDSRNNVYSNNVTTSLTSLGVKQPFPGGGKKI